MAKAKKAVNKSKKKPIEPYAHKNKQQTNNPPIRLVTQTTNKDSGKKTHAYDSHSDPQLV